MTVVLKSVKPL